MTTPSLHTMGQHPSFILFKATLLLIFALTASQALSSLLYERHVHLEGEVPVKMQDGWELTDEVPDLSRPVELLFLIKHTVEAKKQLEQTFWAVSDPDSPTYGKHLTLDEVTEMMAPPEERLAIVSKWLKSHGLDKYKWDWTANRDMIKIRMSASDVAKLLRVQYSVFQHTTTKARFLGTLGPYSVPDYVAPHLDIVSGVLGLPRVKSNIITRERLDKDSDTITPPVLRTRYNVTSHLINNIAKNSHAVAEFQEQYYSSDDLVMFFNQYVNSGKTYNKVAKIIGKNDQSSPGLEAALDVEYIMGVAPNTTTWFISVYPYPFWSDLISWAQILSNTSDIPYVHTVSYGSQGDYPSVSYRERLDTELQKVGVRGLSIIFASGDSGSGCEGDSSCTFYPSYPATNIYVTSVGATRFIHGNKGPEAAVEAFGSGGGFSQLFEMPAYQQAAVSRYFSAAKQLPSPSAYNAKGRATPDVAALGDVEFEVVMGGTSTLVGGTSASAPTFGAIVTFLNMIRLKNGRSPLGFLNPWLYKAAAAHPQAFFDVVVGDNTVPGCGCSGLTGFLCAPGWDPVTGLGTPNFAILKNLV